MVIWSVARTPGPTSSLILKRPPTSGGDLGREREQYKGQAEGMGTSDTPFFHFSPGGGPVGCQRGSVRYRRVAIGESLILNIWPGPGQSGQGSADVRTVKMFKLGDVTVRDIRGNLSGEASAANTEPHPQSSAPARA